jgi:putative ABC transport system substrate-binding protein
MRRREFMALSGAVLIAQALRANGQTKVFRIGYVAATSPEATPELSTALREGLREHGYVEGRNLSIEHRWAEQPSEALLADLVRARVDVIVAWGTHAVAAAKRTTSIVPIVMVGIADPIGAGFVASLSRPGGNITGTTNLARDLGGKLLELLIEIVPELRSLFVLRNPRNPASAFQLREIEVAARAMDLKYVLADATGPDELQAVFARMSREGAKAVLVLADPLIITQRAQIAELARRAGIATVFARRENVDAGGLVSYGPSLVHQFRETAHYVDKILRGEDPAELPVQAPIKLELIVNLKTATALGLTEAVYGAGTPAPLKRRAGAAQFQGPRRAWLVIAERRPGRLPEGYDPEPGDLSSISCPISSRTDRFPVAAVG